MGSELVVRHRYAALAAIGLMGAVVSGCTHVASARMWADSARPAGGFSTEANQWVYDGEPVTFELECDPGAVDYVVFGVDGEEHVVGVGAVKGRYRWTRAFQCGAEPRTLEVYAIPFLIRGECDWIKNRTDDTWDFYPGRNDKADVRTDREQTMKVTCYRKTLRFRFKGRGGAPKQATLILTRSEGGRDDITRDLQAGPDASWAVTGPDDGIYSLTYTPSYQQVSRAGATHAELLVRHADGSTERLEQELETP